MKGIGANGSYGKGDGNDIPRREAFEWYGTTEGKGMATWYANTGPWWTNRNISSNDGISVEEQMDDPASLLYHYRKMLKLRRKYEALSIGTYAHVENNNDFVFSFKRKTESGSVCVAANLSDQVQTVMLKGDQVKLKAIHGQKSMIGDTIQLEPYQIRIWEVR